MKSGFILKRINILANQMISGDGKSVNNRHMWFDSITKSEEGRNKHCTFMASHRQCMMKFRFTINIVLDI